MSDDLRPLYRPARAFEDGVHHVQHAPVKDRHPLPYMIGTFRAAEAKCRRRAATEEEAIAIAKHLTSLAIKKSANDKALHESFVNDQETKRSQNEEQAQARAAKAKLQPFATSHFHCIRANPAAQVWQCVSLPGERGTPGHRKRDGTGRPKESAFAHAKGECAVVLWSEPLRTSDGMIKVFRNWQTAEDVAGHYYAEAYERGEVIGWQEDGKVVERLTEVEIIFDPAVNGVYRPFSLWFPRHNKPHYRPARPNSHVTKARRADGRAFNVEALDRDGQSAHDFNRKLERMAMEERERTRLSEEIFTFRSIVGAEKEALRLERTYFGNADLYP